jgi:hypothetical protein
LPASSLYGEAGKHAEVQSLKECALLARTVKLIYCYQVCSKYYSVQIAAQKSQAGLDSVEAAGNAQVNLIQKV